MKARNRKSGFTLVEILIVVIILGILAAIVIPQFTEASSDARESSLISNLQTIRSQIELYKVQHNDDYPNNSTSSFEDCMTAKTDVAGDTVADGAVAADAIYGPYLQQIPVNPFKPMGGTVRVDGAAAGAGTEDWRFDSLTGALQADDGGSNGATPAVAHADM